MKEQIREAMKAAMRAKESERVTTLRGLLAGFTNELVAQKRPPSEELSEADMIKVIKRAAKQRRDSIEQFEAGNRQDLADKEKRELKILEAHLPETATKEAIAKVVTEKIGEMGAAGDMSKMGMLMGAVIKEFKGTADGADVKAVVSELLAK